MASEALAAGTRKGYQKWPDIWQARTGYPVHSYY